MKTKFNVLINNRLTTLRLVQKPNANADGYTYNTSGNTSAHTFLKPLNYGDKFRMTGNDYEVLYDK